MYTRAMQTKPIPEDYVLAGVRVQLRSLKLGTHTHSHAHAHTPHNTEHTYTHEIEAVKSNSTSLAKCWARKTHRARARAYRAGEGFDVAVADAAAVEASRRKSRHIRGLERAPENNGLVGLIYCVRVQARQARQL